MPIAPLSPGAAQAEQPERLDADGNGGISAIAGAAYYLQPGGSSLLSRGVYNMDRVAAEEMRRTDPDLYRRQVKEGYPVKLAPG